MTAAAKVYGDALYELARSEGLTDTLWQEISALRDSFAAEPDILRFLTASGISKTERCGLLESCFRGRVHPYVLHFLMLLTQRGHIRHFPECCAVYRTRYDGDCGILRATAVTAAALRPAQTERMTQKQAAITGKTVVLSHRTDPALLGGVRLELDGRQLEDTLKHRLDTLRETLKNTVL